MFHFSFRAWLRRISGRFFRSPIRYVRRAKQFRTFRPLMEVLEIRLVPVVFLVTNLNDSGAGSLRSEIAAAPAGGTVKFANGLSGTITLTSGQLSISKNLTVQGPGASTLAVSGHNASRVFDIGSSATVSITALTIEAGFNNDSLPGGSGGGILNDGTLSLANDTITGSYARYDGGGIANYGTLTLTDSTVSGNTANYAGGGIANYGNYGTVNATNTTFSGNQASDEGGAIFNHSGTVVLLDSTISGNTATPANFGSGGGIYTSSSAQTSIGNSILSGNFARFGYDTFGNAITDNGNNLLGAALQNQGETQGHHDVFSDTPVLTSLQNNGGPTETLAPLPGSPALGAGDPGQAGTTAQNGVVRPSGSVDIGAVEDPRFTVNTTADSDDGSATGSTVSLRDAIKYGANATPGVSLISFSAGVTGTITLGGTELPQITGDAGIIGPGASNLAVSGNDQSRVFDIASIATVSISGLTIEDGNASNDNLNQTYGGAISNDGTLILADSTVSGSSAEQAGGGIYSRGPLTITNSTVSGNYAKHGAGGILSQGPLTLTNSTVANNRVWWASYTQGGGIAVARNASITDSTVTGNYAWDAGGIAVGNLSALTLVDSTVSGNRAGYQNGGIGLYGTLQIANTILAGNTAGNYNPDLGTGHNAATFTDSGNNLLGTQLPTAGTGDVSSNTPMLAPLGNYGGPTETRPPLPGSPAIGAGDPTQAGTTAQNGVVRLSGSVDIGAVEDPRFVVNTTADSNDGSASGATVSLRDAIKYGADANSGVSVITFDPTVFNPSNGPYTITLAGSELPQVTGDVQIDGPGMSNLAVSGNSQSRVFDIASGVTVDISGLTIEDGNGFSAPGVGASNGGAILNAGVLTLSNSTVSGSTATGSLVNYGVYGYRDVGGNGGGISNLSGASLFLSDSVVTGNKAVPFNSGGLLSGGSGGGILNQGYLQVAGSSITHNNAYHIAYGGGYRSGYGGGIDSNSDSTNPLVISDSTISDNTGQGGGGGIFSFVNHGAMTLTNSSITGNSVGKYGTGGGIWLNNNGVINDSTIANNTATNYGSAGGIWAGITTATGLTITNSTIADNQAFEMGGIDANSGTLSLIDSTV